MSVSLRAVEILVEERDALRVSRDEAERDYADATTRRNAARNRSAELAGELAAIDTAINALGGEPKRKSVLRRSA